LQENDELTQELLNFLNTQIKWIAEYPEHARIRTEHGTNSTIIEIKMDPRDTGKIIGRHGAVIGSIRTLINGYCRRHGRNVYLQVLEARRSRKHSHGPRDITSAA
jgi:predicted RNA-binding protein YlqC (UPF0109 family)